MRLTFFLSLLLSFSALAQTADLDLSFPCKEAMEKDLARRKKRIKRLDIAGIVIANTIVGLPIGFTLAGTAERNMRFHRNQEHLITALGLAKYSSEEIVERMRKQAIAEGTVFARRASDLQEINRNRRKVGYGPMTEEEYDAAYPLINDLPNERSWNEIMEIRIQIERATQSEVNHVRFVELLRRLQASDELCKHGKVERVDTKFFFKLKELL